MCVPVNYTCHVCQGSVQLENLTRPTHFFSLTLLLLLFCVTVEIIIISQIFQVQLNYALAYFEE